MAKNEFEQVMSDTRECVLKVKQVVAAFCGVDPDDVKITVEINGKEQKHE